MSDAVREQVLYAVFLSVMALAWGVRAVAYVVQKLRSLRKQHPCETIGSHTIVQDRG